MAFINIHTNNLSRELRNNATIGDNWVFVPGTTITGDPNNIYMFTSLNDFKDTCGTYSPEGSITYEYVAGLLSAGLPVLFKRIASSTEQSGGTVSVQKAKVELTHTAEDSEVSDLRISEKFGGTFGNNLSINVRNTGSAYYLDVYLNKITLLESKRLISYNSKTEEQIEINTRLIEALQKMEFNRIEVEVLITAPESFNLQAVSNKQLTGGTDLDESLVPSAIPAVYQEIKDKILFEPKFLTSGGYTDSAIETSHPIAEAMMEVALIRQDCRALIDLPINTEKDKQQELAAEFAYTQNSNTRPITSASICAPWAYMQVGNKRLWMPPSYVYLSVMGDSISRGDKSYTPKAGLSTGVIPNIIRPQFEVGSDIADQWQKDGEAQINPIMKLQSSSYVIAGNSTLLLKDMNSGEENVFTESSADLTVIEIRRIAYKAALEIQYRYNSLDSFENFSLRVAKKLDAMITEGAITKYDIENISTDDSPRTLKVRLDVFISPTIKNIDIYLNISYGSVEVGVGGEN